jgi:pimeloyl-ACP methyl ester carboxylesterase
MSASTWAPLMPALGSRRLIAFDLPGFGLSDAFDYSGRSLREHAVAQLTSLLDALGLEQVPIVGTSLGGRWALCLALDAPNRVAVAASPGVPAVALARGVIGPRAADRAPDGFFDVVHDGMRWPGFGTAMLSHMRLAMQLGRPRPENFLPEAELWQLTVPVLSLTHSSTNSHRLLKRQPLLGNDLERVDQACLESRPRGSPHLRRSSRLPSRRDRSRGWTRLSKRAVMRV